MIPETPVKLDFDEFVADMWGKGVRYGIDEAAVRHGINSPKGDRVTVARRLDPEPSVDAHVVEVSQELHRSDAPRTRADGRVDLASFQNRFPQIRKGMRLLRKMPGVQGARGLEVTGTVLLSAPPADLDFRRWIGEGTSIDRGEQGEYLIADKDGFLDVDAKAGTISVRDKIVSREGVSGRTTGNLELAGAFEEFGDVQELRDVHGSDITIRGNVFGNIHSSGGEILLGGNIVGGSAINAKGDIKVKGVASSSTLHTKDGEIVLKGRAENCVLIGTKVTVEEASNCDIVADEVHIVLAEGCAVAARSIDIDSAGPRRQTEMLVLVHIPDTSHLDAQLTELEGKVGALEGYRAQFQREAEQITSVPQVRAYMNLTARLRKGEATLTPEQAPQLKKMAALVEPQLKQVGQLLQKMKAAESQVAVRRAQLAELRKQKDDLVAQAHCTIKLVSGDVTVRSLALAPGVPSPATAAPKEVRAFLRGPLPGATLIFSDSTGSVDCHGIQALQPVQPADEAGPDADEMDQAEEE
nr:FapA family protein [Pseudoduganella ginsengisoli]